MTEIARSLAEMREATFRVLIDSRSEREHSEQLVGSYFLASNSQDVCYHSDSETEMQPSPVPGSIGC